MMLNFVEMIAIQIRNKNTIDIEVTSIYYLIFFSRWLNLFHLSIAYLVAASFGLIGDLDFLKNQSKYIDDYVCSFQYWRLVTREIKLAISWNRLLITETNYPQNYSLERLICNTSAAIECKDEEILRSYNLLKILSKTFT